VCVCVCVCVCAGRSGVVGFLNGSTLTAEAEQRGTEHLDLAGAPPPQRKSASDAPTATTAAVSPETKKKSKGLRKFFGR